MKNDGKNQGPDIPLQSLSREQQKILDYVPAWIFYKDKENRFLWVNKNYAAAHSISREELIGKPMSYIYTQEQSDRYWRDDKEVMVSGKPKINIVEPAKAGDRVFWVRTDKIPYRNEKGDIIGIIGFSIDITESKAAEEALKNSKELLLEITAHIPGVVYQFYARPNGEAGLYYMSSASEKIFGLKNDRVGYFDRLAELVIPEYREAFLKSIEKSVKELSEWKFEGIAQKPSGERIWFSGHSFPSRRKDEVIFNGILSDITEYKRMELALRESGIKYKTIFDSSSDAIMMIGRSRRFTAGNKATLKMFGCKDEAEFISQSPATLSPEYQPDGARSVEKANKMMDIAMAKGSNEFEWLHKTLTGKKFYANVVLTRFELEGESLLQSTVRDISEKKAADEKIGLANEEWVRTFNAIPDLIFIIDNEHTIKQANESFYKTLNLKPENVIGRRCYEIMHKLDKPWPGCPVVKTKCDKKPHIEEVNDPAIGMPLLVSTSPILNDKKECTGIVHVAKDITQSKKYEAELEKRLNELERFQKITVGRELRMKELKERISELEARVNNKS